MVRFGVAVGVVILLANEALDGLETCTTSFFTSLSRAPRRWCEDELETSSMGIVLSVSLLSVQVNMYSVEGA